MRDAPSPDADRFERLYREHRDRVFATCLRLAGDRVRAQEWMQDAFVRIWEQMDALDDAEDAGGWVYTVTVRTVLNARRSDRRRLSRVALADDLGGVLPERAAGDISPLATPAPMRRIAIERAMETLSGRARQVFVLHDVEGHPTDEVAELLRMAPSTVRVQLARARADARGARLMTRHLDELELSELIDARPLPVAVAAHAAQCADCRLRAEQLRTVRAEAALERVRTYDTPDPWPRIAALTVDHTAVRREVLRRLWVPLFVWTLTAFLLGVIATEAVRGFSRAIAEFSVRAIPGG